MTGLHAQLQVFTDEKPVMGSGGRKALSLNTYVTACLRLQMLLDDPTILVSEVDQIVFTLIGFHLRAKIMVRLSGLPNDAYSFLLRTTWD